MLSREKERVVTGKVKSDDRALDLSLRPKKIGDFIGQTKIKENLGIFLGAARKRGEPIEHTLLYGPPGLGKTTLAFIIAREMGANIKVTSGPAIEKAGDLASLLTNLEEGDILFVDEIHRMNKIVEEVLYPAMEDFVLDIVVGQGPSAKSIRLDLPRFTIIGATTRIGLLSSPLRDRFGATYRLNFYNDGEIEQIIRRSSEILKVKIDEAAVKALGCCARKTPRIANRLLKRVRDFAEVKASGEIDEGVARDALKMLDVDQLGLDQTDRGLLEVIIEKFDGGPVGLKTLAAATSEEVDTIEDVYEPFLLQAGLLARTPKGRVATKLAYGHLGIKYNRQEPLI